MAKGEIEAPKCLLSEPHKGGKTLSFNIGLDIIFIAWNENEVWQYIKGIFYEILMPN